MIPDAVRDVVDAWRVAGSPREAAVAWHRDRWISALPDYAATLGALPDALDRDSVRAACTSARQDPRAALGAFVAVMAWGSGTTGFGPHRTANLLSRNRDAGSRLRACAQTVHAKGPLPGYRVLATTSRMVGLGPAFGTKFLFFVSRVDAAPALILDALMAKWLLNNAGVSYASGGWNPQTYSRYLGLMRSWASELEIATDQLEECMSSAQAAIEGSQWGSDERRRVRAAAAAAPARTSRADYVQPASCPTCSMVLPTSGVCVNCSRGE